jgi:uncharacterized protein (DUF2237 family)
METKAIDMAKNVLGGELAVCGTKPLTGWTRNGCCETDDRDFGSHSVCAIVDERFLRYSAAVGNDLSTPGPSFDGLNPGDRWCLCASRWRDAYRDGMAPPVVLEACHERALDVVDLDILKAHAAKP